MKNLNLILSFCAVLFLSACNEGGSISNKGVTKSDTVVSGLGGTRDQSGRLSTDVKPDTTSGQTGKVRPLGQQADSINTIKMGEGAK